MGNIGVQDRGKEREGQGERPQGPTGGIGEKIRRGRKERGRSGMAVQRGRDGMEEDDRVEEDNGRGVARARGPRFIAS